VRISGVWTEVTAVFRNIGGTWTQIYPDDTIFSNNASGDTFSNPSTGYSQSFIKTQVQDSNGNQWTHVGGNGLIQYEYDASPALNKTTIRVGANVSETYWSRMTWGSTGSILRSSRDTFTVWNGTYTQWTFTGNGLQLGLDSKVLKIYA
jgi:hypothetical protein